MAARAVTMFTCLSSLIAVLTHGSPALSNGFFVGSPEITNLVNGEEIFLMDSVTGGCMSRPQQVEVAAELSLRRNKIEVFKGANTKIFIAPVGFATKIELETIQAVLPLSI